MRFTSPIFAAALALLCCPIARADDAGVPGDEAAGTNDETAAAANETPLAKARALDEAGNATEAIAAYEVALASAASKDDAAIAYCRIARLEADNDKGGDAELVKRIARYVEACVALTPDSEDSTLLSLKYAPMVATRLDAEGLTKHIARLLPLIDKPDADSGLVDGHRIALLRLSHLQHLAGDARAAATDEELLRRYDSPTTRCNLAEASFTRWNARRDDSADLDELEGLMAECIKQMPSHPDMPGLLQDLRVFRYARPTLLGGSIAILLIALALAFFKRDKGAPRA